MHGHWLSQTRKLNKHYQNGGPQEKMAGAIIRDVSALNAMNLPFVWRINPETGAREMRLGLCAYFSLDAQLGEIRTMGGQVYTYWDENYVEGLIEEGETNEWVLFDFIPHMDVMLYYGNSETGTRATRVNTRDKTKFEINTGKVKTTVEELTFKNFVNFGQFAWRDYNGNQTIEPFSTLPVSIGGVCIWINKSQMAYNTNGKYYNLTAAKCKEILDEVDFGVQFYRKNITTARIHVRSTGIGYPYFTYCPFEGDFYGIEKTYHPQTGVWSGWGTANGSWSQSLLSGEVITRTYETPSGSKHKISNKDFSRFVYEVGIILPYTSSSGENIFTLMDGMNPCNNSTAPSSVSFSCNGTYMIPTEDEEGFVPYGTINSEIKSNGYCDIEFATPEKIWYMRGNDINNVGKKLYKLHSWHRTTTSFWSEMQSNEQGYYIPQYGGSVYTPRSNFYSSNAIMASSEVHYET